VSELHSSLSRFDRRASTYEDSTLQQFLFVSVHQTALHLALQLRPQARRVLDGGCGTGRLLRRARQCYPTAELVGVDLAGRMVATAKAVTPTKLAVRYVHSRAERLPFTDDAFDLVFATLSLRHWANPPAGIAEIGRVLSPGGLLVLADVFPSRRRRGPVGFMLRRRRAVVPAELGAVLAAQRLAVIGCDHARWFMLPDVQVIAAQQPPYKSIRPASLPECAAAYPRGAGAAQDPSGQRSRAQQPPGQGVSPPEPHATEHAPSSARGASDAREVRDLWPAVQNEQRPGLAHPRGAPATRDASGQGCARRGPRARGRWH
jgi:SAM-dependent methyltransferase